MRFNFVDLTFLLGCASIATAAPATEATDLTTPISHEEAAAHLNALHVRQFGGGGFTSNDIKQGKCAPLTWIFARGSTEPGNMGASVGPSVAKHLKKHGDVAVQGVDYTASIASNVQMGRGGKGEMVKMIKLARSKCPNTKIAIGGYSQGGMVTHQALGDLSEGDVDVAITYGDPMQRTGFKNIPESKTKKYCNPTDGVCKTGGFAITPGHMTYTTNGDTKDGANFIMQNIGSTSGGSSSSGSDSSSSGGSDSSSGGSSGLGSLGSLGDLGSLGSGSSMLGGSSGASDSAESTDDSSSSSTDSGSSSGMGSLGSLGSLSSLMPSKA